jgi:hypothetical protein
MSEANLAVDINKLPVVNDVDDVNYAEVKETSGVTHKKAFASVLNRLSQGQASNTDALDKSLKENLDCVSDCLNKWKEGEETLVDLMDLLPKKEINQLRSAIMGMMDEDIRNIELLRIQKERLKRGGKVA